MTRKRKLIQKFLDKPKNIGYSKIEKILLWIGFERVEAKGSHTKFKYKNISEDLIFPLHKGDCKIYYKKAAAKLIIKHKLISYD